MSSPQIRSLLLFGKVKKKHNRRAFFLFFSTKKRKFFLYIKYRCSILNNSPFSLVYNNNVDDGWMDGQMKGDWISMAGLTLFWTDDMAPLVKTIMLWPKMMMMLLLLMWIKVVGVVGSVLCFLFITTTTTVMKFSPNKTFNITMLTPSFFGHKVKGYICLSFFFGNLRY